MEVFGPSDGQLKYVAYSNEGLRNRRPARCPLRESHARSCGSISKPYSLRDVPILPAPSNCCHDRVNEAANGYLDDFGTHYQAMPEISESDYH